MDKAQVPIAGNDPLRDGMNLSVRLRYDFTVTDAARLLAAARRLHLDLHPEATPEEAAAIVTCAADAIFTVLEHAGLGETLEARLTGFAADGLETGGFRAQAVIDEPDPLPAGWDCFRTGDVFALPPSSTL
ncbi:hypothetical protein AB0J72_51040 [Dactylosporangium sp. NPDC049742]|uniref:hypothetical protein n=1 Tax=Dactylosporangium sp. NPDC049742 TaxID=3154737 RepID=UPI0034307B22